MLPALEEPGRTEVPRGGWALDGQDVGMGRLRESCPWRPAGRSGVCRVGRCGVGRGRHEENSLSRDKSLSQDSGR